MPESHLLSFDCEEYFPPTIPPDEWDLLPSRVDWATRYVLDILDEYSATATFFVVGWVANRHPQLVREIVARGHALGCHSYYHRLLFSMTPAQFRDDTRRARTVIEQTSGIKVRGYRAPCFSITPITAWAIAILAEEGFTYDSSIFPVLHDVYGWPGAPRHAHRLGATPMWEFPPATFRILRKLVLPVGGGGYLRMLPKAYTDFGLRRANEDGRFLLYFHPWEFDPYQPRLPSKLVNRLRHNIGLRRMERRFRSLLATYHFTSIESALCVGHLEASTTR